MTPTINKKKRKIYAAAVGAIHSYTPHSPIKRRTLHRSDDVAKAILNTGNYCSCGRSENTQKIRIWQTNQERNYD